MGDHLKKNIVAAAIGRRLDDWKDCRIFMSDIARETGVSVETVRQVFLSNFNLTRQDQVRERERRVSERRSENRKQKELLLFGDQLSDLRKVFGDDVDRLVGRYKLSKINAIRASGPAVWSLTFRGWLAAWEMSGYAVDHPQRVCLVRIDYTRPYADDNVRFVSVKETGCVRLIKARQVGRDKELVA